MAPANDKQAINTTNNSQIALTCEYVTYIVQLQSGRSCQHPQPISVFTCYRGFNCGITHSIFIYNIQSFTGNKLTYTCRKCIKNYDVSCEDTGSFFPVKNATYLQSLDLTVGEKASNCKSNLLIVAGACICMHNFCFILNVNTGHKYGHSYSY